MSRRFGQSGYIEKKGNAYYVRFRIDVAGQDERAYKSVRICPTHGIGSMTKPERARRAKELIAESGADSPELFNRVQGFNLGVTFKQQSETWLKRVKTRKRRPIKPATASSWTRYQTWINTVLGEMPFASVNNLALKELVCKMSEAKFSPKTMHDYLQVVKMVVASAVNEQGEELHPRKWNHEFIDLPQVTNQRTPTFNAEDITKILAASTGDLRVLFAPLSGTGMRVGEALALEVKDICGTTITVRQGVWNGIVQSPKTASGLREIDVHSTLAALLKEYIAGRKSGFLFQNASGKPISQTNVLKRGLHPVLESMKREKCGFHSFRRYRVTHLRKNRVPEDLLRFWIGHADQSVTDHYSKVKEDVEFRNVCAENVGLGFEIPVAELKRECEVAPSCTQNDLVPQNA